MRRPVYDDSHTCSRCFGVIIRGSCVMCGHDPRPRVRVRLANGTTAFMTWREIVAGGR